MNKESKNKGKEGDEMALLAKSCNQMIIIDKNKTKQFLEESKNNIIKPEFLKRRTEYSDMLHKEDKNKR